MATRIRLLETPAARVPDELAASVRAFCEPIGEIRTAYVGLTEVTEGFQHPREELAVAFELLDPSPETAEGDRELRDVADRFYAAMPESVQAGGCNFPGVEALPVWHEKARRVFSRPGS
jgi:hypothetical protein